METMTQTSVDLAAIREQRGLSLEQIASWTKIRVSWLQAIEDGRWSELPGGIYRRSYIRQYAQMTGVDEEAVLSCCPSEILMEC